MDNFWILWPLFAKHTFDVSNLHPILYLTLTSIGAMYGGKETSCYGAVMHEKLRDVLSGSLFELTEVDADSLSLGQSRVLTQAAALYFGQKRGFSYAQHIGSVLIAQARRMDLFASDSNQQSYPGAEDDHEAKTWLNGWLRSESRKRLAFAIMRVEMYTSVLLGSRSLVSSEELECNLPCNRYLWHTAFTSSSAFVAAIRQDAESSTLTGICFSDLVRIALDQDESLPPIDLLSRELLMMALQEPVWRACRQGACLPRLTRATVSRFIGDDGVESTDTDSASSPPPRKRRRTHSGSRCDEDHLIRRTRSMRAVCDSRKQLALNLRGAQRSLLMASDTIATTPDRSCLMSCLLLHHLSFFRLHSDVEALHSISYRTADGRTCSPHIWSSKRGSGARGKMRLLPCDTRELS